MFQFSVYSPAATAAIKATADIHAGGEAGRKTTFCFLTTPLQIGRAIAYLLNLWL